MAISLEDGVRTLGSLSPALLLQAPGGAVPNGSSGEILGLIARSSGISKGVLLSLILLSIFSWSIFLFKWWLFRRAGRQSTQFLDVFRRSTRFSEVQAVCPSLSESPLVGLFRAGYAELTTQLRQNPSTGPPPAHDAESATATTRPTLKSLTAVDRALTRASVVEVGRLEAWLTVLATTASISPFIGLFGTVWGIMGAFEGIGQTGSTNLGVVAPGIAEALVTTAAGLAAAIPAVLFYNYLVQKSKVFASRMDDFAMEFLNIAERNFT